jgi:hypothetical protein
MVRPQKWFLMRSPQVRKKKYIITKSVNILEYLFLLNDCITECFSSTNPNGPFVE